MFILKYWLSHSIFLNWSYCYVIYSARTAWLWEQGQELQPPPLMPAILVNTPPADPHSRKPLVPFHSFCAVSPFCIYRSLVANICQIFFFFAVILWNPRKNAGLPSHPLGCCCCLWQTRSEHQLFPHRCDSASRLAGATRARVKKVGIRQKHANLPTWDHKNVLI